MVYKVVQQSAILRPTATNGVVSSGPKVSVVRLGSEHFATAPVGNSFHIYDCENLQLQYLSRPLLGKVSCALSICEFTVAAVGSDLFIFHKMVLLAKLAGHTCPVAELVNIETDYLISRSATEVLVWQLPELTRDMKPITLPVTPLSTLPVSFAVHAMMHVPGYANKILLAGSSGSELQLWNVKSNKMVYQFLSISTQASPILSLAASPVSDVIAVGQADGTISVMNIRSDELVMSLNQAEHGAVTALAFRADYADGMLVSGTERGDLVVWNLTKKSIHSFIQKVHPGGVGSLTFLSTLPLMLSSGVSDNAISVYIFDKPDGGCRLLKERRGFTVDFSFILPYGDNDLIVGGSANDKYSEIGKINLIQSRQDLVWSQAHLSSQTPGKASLMPWKFRNLSQLPPVTDIAYCGSLGDKLRHYDWPAVITAHKNIRDSAYVWSAHQQALVTRQLIIPRKATSSPENNQPDITALAVSTCGNYAVLGCSNGELHRFNLQSCYHRGLVGTMDSAPIAMEFLSSREILVVSKNEMKIWKIVPRPVETGRVSCVTDIARIAVRGFLCAVAHETPDSVSIIDLHADSLARKIKVTAPVTSMAWSDGGRWLAIATADARLVIYDVPTASIVDRVEFESVCSAIRFHKHNTQIITAHVGGKGAVRIWQNIALLEGPGVVTNEFVPIDRWSESSIRTETVERKPKRKLAKTNSVTLSSQQWQHILRLDEIKQRNKPSKPAEKPKEAPFFLPVVYKGMQPVFVNNTMDDQDEEKKIKKDESNSSNDFISLIKQSPSAALTHLINQTPAGVHICIAELGDDEDALNEFIAILASETVSGRNADLVATWTALVLKEYGVELRGRKCFEENLVKLHSASANAFTNFTALTNQLQCLLKVTAALQLHR
jgi:U3 small nucleolar RNA-associated protein 21